MGTNVVWGFIQGSSVIQKIFVIFLSLSLYQSYDAVEECDFVKCAISIKSFIEALREPKTRFICKNVLNSSWCSEHCMHQYFPNFLHESINQHNFEQYCDENISNSNANWSCIARHSFQLLTCLANISSLTSNTVREDIMLTESCRKSKEFQNCPREVLLTDCGVKSVDTVKDIFQFILNNFMPFSCKETNLKEVLSTPVYYQLGHEYMEVAKSLDYYYNFINDCFARILDDYDLNGFLCGEYDPLTDCISYQLSIRGKPFPAVRILLLKYFLLGDFKCKQPVSSVQDDSFTEIKSSPNDKVDLGNDHFLSDKVKSSSNSPKTSTSFLKDDNENFHSEIPTVTSVTEKSDKKFEVNDLSENKDSGSLDDSSSEKPVIHSNVNYMKASSAFSLHYDKSLLVLLLIFIFS